MSSLRGSEDSEAILGLCEVLVVLGDSIADAKRPLNARDLLLVQILRSAPLYRDADCLDCWETAFQCAAKEGSESPATAFLELAFGLGRCNLYADFNERETRVLYDWIVTKFDAAGVRTPQSPDLSDW